jgi:hypothetical protein
MGERRVPARPQCAIPWPLPPPLRFQPDAGRTGPGAVGGMGTGPACATPTLARPLVARLCVAVPSAPLACVAARLTHAAPDTSCVGIGWGRRPRGPARSSAGPAGATCRLRTYGSPRRPPFSSTSRLPSLHGRVIRSASAPTPSSLRSPPWGRGRCMSVRATAVASQRRRPGRARCPPGALNAARCQACTRRSPHSRSRSYRGG